MAAAGLFQAGLLDPRQDFDRPTAIRETVQVLQLETVIEAGLDNGTWVNDPKLFGAPFEKSISYSFRYRVRAGFDLESPEFGVTESPQGGWVVRLPRPRVLEVVVNPEYYAWRSRIGNAIEPNDFNHAEDMMRTRAKEIALERDILGKARLHAEESIRAIGQQMGPMLQGELKVEFADDGKPET